jgi:H+/Cl- antiporter ClcA
MPEPPSPAAGTPVAYLRLIGLAAAIGVPAALLAAVFLALVHELEHWLWTDLPDHLGTSSPPWYLVIGLPVVGAAIVVVARAFLPGDGGHSPLLGIGGGVTPLSHGFGVALAAIGTLAFGAVLGPEAPLIALGSVVGMAVTPFVRLGDRETSVLATAGSFSAISALFGGPLVAGMLLIEGGLGMGAALIPALLPGLVAAGVGYLLFVGLGSWGGLNENAIAVPNLPAYHGTHVGDLLIAIAVGIAAAFVVAGVRRLGGRIESLRPKPMSMPALLLLGGLAVGVVAQGADWLGANSQDVLFSGQQSVPVVVAEDSMKIVLVLLAGKAIGYAISLGSGFRGGPVFPAIFIGVALASVAEIIFNTSPTLSVSIGAAAGMAAQTKLLFAPLLFAMLLVGHNGADTVTAAVLATSTAWLVTHTLERTSAEKPTAA